MSLGVSRSSTKTAGPDGSPLERTAERVRSDLAPRLETLNASRVEEGVAYAVTYNGSAAAAWAGEHCPRGDGRRFGSCRVIDGVVVQERAGETTVLAVAYDVTVTSPRGERELTFVVRMTG